MTRIFLPNRRAVMAGLGAGLAVTAIPPSASLAAAPASVDITIRARVAALDGAGLQPAPSIWQLATLPPRDLRLKPGDSCNIRFHNELPIAAAPIWRGLDGAPTPDRLVPPGGSDNFTVTLRHAGTMLIDLWSPGKIAKPVQPLGVIVEETTPAPIADRDQLFLIENWNLHDGMAQVPPAEGDLAAIYTVNGRVLPEFTIAANERLRLRVINFSPRNIAAIRIEGRDITVIAIDSHPAEPFPARNSTLTLAPGSRCDVIIDGTAEAGSNTAILLHDGTSARPIARLVTTEPARRSDRLPPAAALPSDLPPQLDLRAAQRFAIALEPDRSTDPIALRQPAFQVRSATTVVLTLTNPTPLPQVFHLHGQHFRLLDRLDDGWKPYLLDTLAIAPQTTQRVAFRTGAKGRWLFDYVATRWSAMPTLGSYIVT